MNDNYGVIAGIGEGIKIGLFFLQDIACLAAVIVPGVVISQTAFPPTQTKLSFTFWQLMLLLHFIWIYILYLILVNVTFKLFGC